MIATAYTKPNKHVKCPHCDKGEHRVDHCGKGFNSRWSCRECGGHFNIEYSAVDQFILTPLKARTEKILVTLESTGLVRLLVEGIILTDDAGNLASNEEHYTRFFYEEGTCPTNYLKNVRTVVDPLTGDTDGCGGHGCGGGGCGGH